MEGCGWRTVFECQVVEEEVIPVFDLKQALYVTMMNLELTLQTRDLPASVSQCWIKGVH